MADNRYHPLLSTSEIAWTHSGFLRHRRLLQIGNERWDGEEHPGYPCRICAGVKYNFVAVCLTRLSEPLSCSSDRIVRTGLWRHPRRAPTIAGGAVEHAWADHMRAGGPDDGRQDTLGMRDIRQRRGTLQRAWGYHLCERTRTCFLRARL